MPFSLDRIYHPSHRTPDLRDSEEFFDRVFGRHSLPRSGLVMAGLINQSGDYPTNYCTFTPISDVFFDSIAPDKYVYQGKQVYESVAAPYLDGYGWAVSGDIQEAWKLFRANGIRLTDQLNNVVDSEEIPSASFKSTPLFWTLEDDTGLRYEFYPVTSIQSYDHRSLPGWSLPKVTDDDPLRIVRASHHTVLTANPERAHRFFVELLGGEAIAEGDNPAWRTRSTFVRLAGDVHEIAVPEADCDATVRQSLERRLPLDSYHGISFLVEDLERVKEHLAAERVRITWESDAGLVTDPETSIGVAWGFYRRPPWETDGTA